MDSFRLAGAPFALVLATCLTLHSVPCRAASDPPVPLPILSVDPLVRGTVLENHTDALAHWVGRGDARAVLLHVAAGHGMKVLSGESLSALEGLAGRRDLPALSRAGRGGSEGLYDDGNFIRAAAGLGIIREVVWIAPVPIPVGKDAGARMKEFLGKTGLSALEQGSFHPAAGCYQGKLGGIPVKLCSQERLPAIGGTVLLSIGAEYFPHAAGQRGLTLITEIRALFSALRKARYAVRDTVVAHSVLGGHLPPDLRWVGESVLEVLKDPSITQAEMPPQRWNILQKLATLGAGGEPEGVEMLGVALSALEEQPHDPALLLYAAEAAAGHTGAGDRALAYAEEACRIDRGRCVGLREVGLRYLERGEIETGLRFIAAAESHMPGTEYGQLDLGIALMKAGRDEEAVTALEVHRARHGNFPSGFLIGAIHQFKGDRAAARRSFDGAVAAIGAADGLQVVRGEIAHVIATAAAFYREEGLKQQAEQLERDPRLRLPSPRVGP